jgi:hypothetical protein
VTVLVFKFLKYVGIASIEELKLLILEMLPFGGFSAHVDLTGQNQLQ